MKINNFSLKFILATFFIQFLLVSSGCATKVIGIVPKLMVMIPAGEFSAGADPGVGLDECRKHYDSCKRETDDYSNEGPEHKVMLDSFYLDQYEVTQKEFLRIMGKNLSHFRGDNLPVEKVTWGEANTYCKKVGKRLPTEAEWEKAAKGGNNYIYPWGDEYDGLYGWSNKNSGGKTHPVGQKEPNGFGLYDMGGNVWEWVSDWHDDGYYRDAPYKNPKGPSKGSKKKGMRGGSWNYFPYALRSSIRARTSPANRYSGVGFRCAMSVSSRP